MNRFQNGSSCNDYEVQFLCRGKQIELRCSLFSLCFVINENFVNGSFGNSTLKLALCLLHMHKINLAVLNKRAQL